MTPGTKRWLSACATAFAATGCAANAPLARVKVAVADAPAVVVPTGLDPQAPRDGYVEGVENFGFVSADVWRGGKPTPAGLRTLAAMGVKTVIDLQEQDESAAVPEGVRYVPLRVSAWRADRVDTAAVVRAIHDNPKPVFIHCLQGRDRTGLAVAAYRRSQGMSAEQTIRELSSFRVNPWWSSPIAGRIRELYHHPRESPTAATSPHAD